MQITQGVGNADWTGVVAKQGLVQCVGVPVFIQHACCYFCLLEQFWTSLIGTPALLVTLPLCLSCLTQQWEQKWKL